MLITVVIPNYNYSAFLPSALESVIRQTYTNWECIVVDDGSKDNSAEVVLSYSQKDPRIRLIRKTNGGLPSTRNEGIKSAKGEYVAFLDADDYWSDGKLERQVSCIRQTNAEVVFSNSEVFSDTGKLSEEIFKVRKLDVYDFLAGNPIPGCSSSIIVKKSVFDTAGLFDNDLRSSEDLDMLFRICLKGYSFEGVPYTDVFIRKHSGSMQANFLKMYVHKMYCFDKSLKSLYESGLIINRGKFRDAILKRFQSMLWTARDSGRRDLIHYSYYRAHQLLGISFIFTKKFSTNYIYDLKQWLRNRTNRTI